MYGNTTSIRFLLNNLVVGTVNAASSKNVDVDVTAVLPLGCGIDVHAREAQTGGLTWYAVRLDANTIRIVFVNGTAGNIVASDTIEYDVYVKLPTGELQQTI
jgi:hypothetical protein